MKKKSTSQSAFFNLRILTASVFCLLGIAVALFAQGNRTKQTQQSTRSNGAQDAPGTQKPDVVQMVGPVRLDQDLRNLPYVPPKEEFDERILTRYPHVDGRATSSMAPSSPWLQRLIKELWRPTPTMPGPLLTFEGGAAVDSALVRHLTAMAMSARIITSKRSSRLSRFLTKPGPCGGPITYNSFFAPLTGTPCATTKTMATHLFCMIS